jgi:hypothetical protein
MERTPLLRQVGEKIPRRLARVLQVRTESRDGRKFVVYELSDSLRPNSSRWRGLST